MTHLSTTVSAKFLVDLINSYGGMLKAPAKKLISSFFHLFKFLLACSGLLSAGLKSYEKKFVKLIHNKPLSKYTEQICIVYHNKHKGKHIAEKRFYCTYKDHTNIMSFLPDFKWRPQKLNSWDVFNLLCATFVWSNDQNSSPNSFCKLGSPKQHQHLPVTASEHLGFLNMLMFAMLFEDTNNFALMLMSGFWTTYIGSLNYLRKI